MVEVPQLLSLPSISVSPFHLKHRKYFIVAHFEAFQSIRKLLLKLLFCYRLYILSHSDVPRLEFGTYLPLMSVLFKISFLVAVFPVVGVFADMAVLELHWPRLQIVLVPETTSINCFNKNYVKEKNLDGLPPGLTHLFSIT